MTLLPILPLPVLVPLAIVLVVAAVLLLRGGWPRKHHRAGSLRAVGLVVLVLLAALRPGFPGGSTPQASSELNVFFVVDSTSSANAEDYGNGKPRLDGMKADINALALALPGARYSMITFDRAASVRLPLTTDAAALETMTEILTPEVSLYSHGSSVTVAAGLLKERLLAAQQAHPERPRLVFYLGDGEQTAAGKPEPFNLPDALVSGGAVLGYGTKAGGRMKEYFGYDAGQPAEYIQDYSSNQRTDAISRIDEQMLGTLAQQLSVPYVHRSAGDPITAALTDAKPAALTPDSSVSTAGRIELYWLFALGAFVLAAWELLDSGRRLRRLSTGATLDQTARQPTARQEMEVLR